MLVSKQSGECLSHWCPCIKIDAQMAFWPGDCKQACRDVCRLCAVARMMQGYDRERQKFEDRVNRPFPIKVLAEARERLDRLLILLPAQHDRPRPQESPPG